jgi:hypothetical protein
MRKATWQLLVLSALVVLAVGCGKNNPVAPSQPVPAQGGMRFALDAASNVVSGRVVITKGGITLAQLITITNHSGTVSFNSIQVGTWQLQVHLFDGNGLEIYTGSGTAQVNQNVTTSVTVQSNQNTGNLQIIVKVPGGYVNNQVPALILSGYSAPYSAKTDGTGLCVLDATSHLFIFKQMPTANSATPSPDILLGSLGASDAFSDGFSLFMTFPGYNDAADWDYFYNMPSMPSMPSPNIQISNLNQPGGISCDKLKVYVADTANNRVLIFNTIPSGSTAYSATPDVVLSYPAGTLPTGVSSDGVRLCVANNSSAGVYIYNHVPTANSAVPDVTLAVPGASVCTDGSRLFLADTPGNRVLIYNSVPTANVAPDVVIGGLSAPRCVSSDGARMFVADTGNNRVLMYLPQ